MFTVHLYNLGISFPDPFPTLEVAREMARIAAGCQYVVFENGKQVGYCNGQGVWIEGKTNEEGTA